MVSPRQRSLNGALWVLLCLLAGRITHASEYEAVEHVERVKRQRSRPIPIVNTWLLGGQDMASRGSARDSGIASMLAAVSFPVGERWKITPTYQGYFQATRQVLDAGGSGTTLFQSRMDHRLGGKLFYEANERHRLKFSFGSRLQLLKETNDEKWGHGLFDFRKLAAGIEWEYFYRRPASVRLGYDFFTISFPNYYTLESRGALRVNGQTVARELAGGRVLDSRNHSFLAGVNGPIAGPSWVWDVTYIGSLQQYPDQPLSNAAGQFDSTRRKDFLHEITSSVRGSMKPGWPDKIYMGIRATITKLKSNQGNFNAAENRFFPGYYDVRTIDLMPSMILYFRNPLEPTRAVQLSSSYGCIFALYPGRFAQSGNGAYQGKGLRTSTYAAVLTLTWPLRRHLNAMLSFRDTRAVSNMKYEALYKYNFASRSYLIGLGYEL